jgi:flagellar protein FliL
MADTANKSASPTQDKSKSSKATIALVALVALSAGGGSAWFFSQRSLGVQAAKPKEDESTSTSPKYLVHLEGFTVNLNDPEETHFLRVTIDLGLDHLPKDSEKEKPSALLPMARIRDVILSVLTMSKANVLLTPEGKVQLKKDLLEALKRNVPEAGIREVYFTEFLVQR